MAVICEPEMRAKFLAVVRSFELAKSAAKALGISQQYLSDMMNGRREISDEVARKLGYRKVVRYQRMEKAKEADADRE